jgi:hypothetical protein
MISLVYFIHSFMALQPFVGPWSLLRFRNLFHTDGRTPVARPLPTQRTTQIFMPRMGFEPTIPVFERAKTVHGLDRAATRDNYTTEIETDQQTSLTAEAP